jgi:hypothetical protein
VRSTRAGILKRGILLFWSLWVSVVVAMNVADLLKAVGVLPAEWTLASGNYDAIVRVTEHITRLPAWLDVLLLAGATLWETVCLVLFWWAYRVWPSRRPDRWPAVYLAFAGLLALFGGFILIDELFHAYKTEGDHRGIAVLLLASLLALQLLPEREEM